MARATTQKPITLPDDALPAFDIPPGDTLREELAARGLKQKEFAEAIGRKPQIVNDIINGRKAITPETALQFEKALDISAKFWLNLESDYRLNIARRKLLAQ